MTTLFVQSPTLYLAGSGAIIGATSITLTSLTDIYGNVLTMADFGSAGYITLEPDTTNAEAATFTGVTANANGTYTLTGIKTGLAKSPYTETSGLVRNHAGGTKVVVTDNVEFWNTFVNKNNDGTMVGYLSGPTPVSSGQYATKGYVDGVAIAGAPTASTTVLGIAKLSVDPAIATSPIVVETTDGRIPTQSENDALVGNNTDIAVGSGNKFVTQTGFQKNAEKYAADAGANDTYAITLSPVPTSYATGMVVHFKANTANTGACTLNVNSLGAKTIKRDYNVDLDTGDILANQLVSVIYDGTNFQMISPLPVKTYNGVVTISTSTTTTITCGFRPKLIRISAFNGNTNYGVTSSNGSYSVAQATNRCTYITYASGGNTFGVATDTTNCVNLAYGTGTTTVTALINNITGTGFDIVSTVSGGTAYCSYEVIG